MSDKSLEIRISADLKNFEDAMKKIERETEALTSRLSQMAMVGGAAFAGLAAFVGVSVKAYGVQEAATRELSQSLQIQGIYTDELLQKYEALANAIESKTGQDAQQLKSGMAVLQGYLGEIEVTEDLAAAVSDLAAAKGIDLKTAAEMVGKTIGTSTNALKKQGLEIDSSATKTEKLTQVIDQINGRFKGQAEAAAQGTGAFKLLSAQFDNFLQAIGERFAPIISAMAKSLASFFEQLNQNKAMMDFIVSLTTAGLVVSGVVAIVGAGGLAVMKLKAALDAARASTLAMKVATRGLLAATGLGLLVILATEIYLNWNSIWPRMQAVFQAFSENIVSVGSGLKEFLAGVFTLDVDRIKAGIEQVKNAVVKGFNEATREIEPIKPPAIEQNQALAEAAKERRRIEDAEMAWMSQRLQAEKDLRLMKAGETSKTLQDLKSKEVEILKSLEERKNADIAGLLKAQLDRTRQMMAEQTALETEQRQIMRDQILAENAEFHALTEEQKRQFYEQTVANEQLRVMTQGEAEKAVAAERLKNQVDTHNRFLTEQVKFGKAYATINRALYSEEVQGFKSASAEMAQLHQSSNNTLKSIGKAFALSDIAMKTAQSAMNVYAGFSTIPIVGQALGLAAAAAAIAFGGEQAGKVMAAAEGGILTGGIRGKDSIPVLGMPGELVVPTKNFDEVVNSVADRRNGTSSKDPESVDLLRSIDAKISSLRGITVVGDVLADDSYIDTLCRRISDAIQYRNAQIYGVNI